MANDTSSTPKTKTNTSSSSSGSFHMSPLIGQGLIDLGGSLVAGLIGAHQQAAANRQNQKNFERQLEFNKSEAIAGREAQKISTQAREMQRAGLNPLGAAASLGSSPVSASSSALPNIVPSDNFASQFGLAARNIDVAQIQNLDANTRKTAQETEGVKYTNEILASDAKFRDAINSQHVDLESSTTKLNLNMAQRTADLTPLECEQLRASTKVALQQVDNMQKDLERMDAVIRNLDSQNKLNVKKCDEIAQNIKESIARTFKTYKETHKLDKDMEYLDNLIEQVKVSVSRDNIQLGLEGLDLKLMLKDGGYELRKASIDYDRKLLPISKTTAAFAPVFQCAGSAIGDAAKIAGVVLK